MSVLWTVPMIAGLVIAALASRRAVISAIRASEAANVDTGLVGVTVLAIGTDLPEIASSIVASLSDHGDVVVGDAAGSAMTQVTLVLAILAFTAVVRCEPRLVALLGTMTVAALLLDAQLVRDGSFSRLDGALLVAAWVLALVVVRSSSAPETEGAPSGEPVGRHLLATLGWLAVVAAAATAVVQSFVRVTEAIGVPELVASAVVLSLGTSLPELVVDVTALRRGAAALALGDLFGSSLLDATLAIGIGPAIRETAVSSDAALTCLLAAAGIAAATIIAARRREHRWASGTALLVVYLAVTAAMITLTG